MTIFFGNECPLLKVFCVYTYNNKDDNILQNINKTLNINSLLNFDTYIVSV